MDLLQRQGHYPVPPGTSPTLGVEFSGVVESLGPEPERDFKVGDEVFGLAYGGSLSFLSLRLSLRLWFSSLSSYNNENLRTIISRKHGKVKTC